MSLLIDYFRGIFLATAVYVFIHLMQSVAFSMNSCQQFERYQYAGDAKPQSIK